MNRTTWLQDRRMTKFSHVLCRWRQKKLSAAEAGEILGMSERTFRRFRQRYEDEGEAGLADRRIGKASARRVPADRLTWMLDLHASRYRDWNVRHFHEHLVKRFGFD